MTDEFMDLVIGSLFVAGALVATHDIWTGVFE